MIQVNLFILYAIMDPGYSATQYLSETFLTLIWENYTYKTPEDDQCMSFPDPTINLIAFSKAKIDLKIHIFDTPPGANATRPERGQK